MPTVGQHWMIVFARELKRFVNRVLDALVFERQRSRLLQCGQKWHMDDERKRALVKVARGSVEDDYFFIQMIAHFFHALSFSLSLYVCM